ncbi:armadillo-type protein [Cladochytrium replicatum]|nr:armadillo-type protein [Cladochytrium replicatum]
MSLGTRATWDQQLFSRSPSSPHSVPKTADGRPLSDYAKKLDQLSRLSVVSNLNEVKDLLSDLTPKTDDDRETVLDKETYLEFFNEILKASIERPGNASYLELATDTCFLLAEYAKIEPTRAPLAQSGLCQRIADLLRIATTHLSSGLAGDDAEDNLKIQCMRVIANLCFENDSNRELFLDAKDVLKHSVECLTCTNPGVLEKTCGALLNVSMENVYLAIAKEPVQQVLTNCNAMKHLVSIVKKTEDPDLRPIYHSSLIPAIAVMSNLVEADPGIARFLEFGGLALIVKLLKTQHETILDLEANEESYEFAFEILDAITTLLETIGENDAVQREIVRENLIGPLLDFVDAPFPKRPDQDEDSSSNYQDIRKTVSRVVTTVTMNDENMADLVENVSIVNRFKSWLNAGFDTKTEVEEDEIRMSGALCLGNLARSDRTCQLLVTEHGVADDLLALMKLEIKRIGDGSADMRSINKVLHAVVGTFKNLSLAVSNRSTLGDRGLVGVCTSVLDMEGLKPLQYGCVGVLKNLCNANFRNTYRTITGLEPPATGIPTPVPKAAKTPLGSLVGLVWKATGDNDTGIRTEGGRAIVQLIRVCSTTQGANVLLKLLIDANVITPLLQIITGATLTRPRQAHEGELAVEDSLHQPADGEEPNEHHVHFDAVSVDGQVFPLVQNEGIVALVLLATANPEIIPRITRFQASLTTAVLKIITSGIVEEKKPDDGTPGSPPQLRFGDSASEDKSKDEYPLPLKMNACILLQTLASGDENFASLVAPKIKPDLLSVLETLQTSAPAPPRPESPLKIQKIHPSGASSMATSSSVEASAAAPPVTVPFPLLSASGGKGGSSSPGLARSGTKSAKPLLRAASDGAPSQRELQTTMGSGTVLSLDADDGSGDEGGLVQAVQKVLLLL